MSSAIDLQSLAWLTLWTAYPWYESSNFIPNPNSLFKNMLCCIHSLRDGTGKIVIQIMKRASNKDCGQSLFVIKPSAWALSRSQNSDELPIVVTCKDLQKAFVHSSSSKQLAKQTSAPVVGSPWHSSWSHVRSSRRWLKFSACLRDCDERELSRRTSCSPIYKLDQDEAIKLAGCSCFSPSLTNSCNVYPRDTQWMILCIRIIILHQRFKSLMAMMAMI